MSENCTPYETARRQCRSYPGPALDAEGCRYYSPRPYPTDTVIYNEKAYTSKEKGLRTLSMFNQQRELSRFSQELLEERGERIGELLAELEAQNAELERLKTALELAYRALTEGMADVPTGERYRKCAILRAEAKRAIRQVLGVAAPEMEAECNGGVDKA